VVTGYRPLLTVDLLACKALASLVLDWGELNSGSSAHRPASLVVIFQFPK